ncbi:MAG: proline iminopeptidase-family hydrolase [Parvularculaceae bacterium]
MISRRNVLLASAGAALAGAGFGGPARALPDPEIAGYIPVPGGRVWYRINGAEHLGGPRAPLLALHGGPGGGHRRMLTMVALADERAVIFYDQLDSGNSDRPGDPANWRTERFLAEIGSVRDALGLDRVALLGHSMGGGWAAAYAIENPPGLAALILSSPLISTPRWIADNTKYREALPADIQAVLDAHEAAGTIDSPEYQAATQVFYDRHLCIAPCPVGDLGIDAAPFNVELYRYMWGPTEFRATGTLVDFDLTPGLPRITAPTLFICGEFDEATPAACRDFAGLVPEGRFVMIENAAHATYLSQRDAYMAAVRRFLREAGA